MRVTYRAIPSNIRIDFTSTIRVMRGYDIDGGGEWAPTLVEEYVQVTFQRPVEKLIASSPRAIFPTLSARLVPAWAQSEWRRFDQVLMGVIR